MTVSLQEGAVHLFRADLERPPIPPDELESLLAANEIARADRFRFPHLRRHHVVATGLLRALLGEIEGRAPDELRFERTEHGKPVLPNGPAFNLSHSGTRLLIGFADCGHLGVDVEAHRPLSNLKRLAEKTFSPSEARTILERSSAAERTAAFFRVWTRKEALVKALGLGLGMPLRAFTVSGEPIRDPRLTNALLRVDDREAFDGSVREAVGATSSWWIMPVPPDPEGGHPPSVRSASESSAPAAAAVAWDRPFAPRLIDIGI